MKKAFALTLVCLLTIAAFAATVALNRPEYGFSVQTPIALTTNGPTHETTIAGESFTQTIFSGETPANEIYYVDVSTYPFTVVRDDLQRAENGFQRALGGQTAQTQETTVSGRPALKATITLPATKFQYLTTSKGTRLYQFAYSGNGDATAFFKSVVIQ